MSITRRTRSAGYFVVGLIVVGSFCSTVRAGDWSRFRGPDGTGIVANEKIPLTWSKEKNVKWRASLPSPGNSSPIVSRDRVFVTVANKDGSRRSLHAFDRATGKESWVRTVEYAAKAPTHATNPYCASSPATDGERVVVWHSSAGLYCYDYEGKELWNRDLGKFVHIWGFGASPIFHKGMVLLNAGPGERTFLTGIDAKTGATIWQTEEPGGASGLDKPKPGEKRAPWVGSWSTPVVTTADGKDQVLVSYPNHVKAYDARTGKVLWQCDGLGNLVYTFVVLGKNVGIAMGGYGGPAIGFRLGGSGNVTDTHRLWRNGQRNPQRIGSGVILGKHLFMANEPGIAQCIDVQTGEELWRSRMPGGKLWGSLLYVDGRLMVTNQKGETILFAPNPEKYEQLGVNSLGERSNSTPAIADGEIFLRTFQAVYCIAE